MVIKTILVALSLEHDCTIVAQRAVQLANQHGAQLVGVHVIPALDIFEPAIPSSVDATDLERIVRDQSASKLKSMLEKAETPAIITVETGVPHIAIDALAASYAADLVIIGAGVSHGVREKIFGSTADRVVRSASCPILVVRNAAHSAYKRIVVGVDFSQAATAAAEFSFHLAPSAARELLHAVSIPLEFKQAMLEAGTPKNQVENYRRAIIDRVEQRISGAFGEHESAFEGFSVVESPPATALLRASQDPATDLLTLGT